MLIAQRLVAVLSLALLGGCGADDAATDRPPPPPIEDTVFKDVVGTMDKARGVEETLQKQKEARDRELAEREAAMNP
jgi:hypothetical protein